MTRPITLTAITLAAVTLACLSTASLAQEDRGPGLMLDQKFDAIDADKDGKVTKAELDAFRAAEVAVVDTNSDGKLDAAELAAMHLARMTKRADVMAAEMIERLDVDGDKTLSATELAARPMPAKLFDRMDADGDGAVTKVEAEAARDKMKARMEEHHGKSGHHRYWGWDMMGDDI